MCGFLETAKSGNYILIDPEGGHQSGHEIPV